MKARNVLVFGAAGRKPAKPATSPATSRLIAAAELNGLGTSEAHLMFYRAIGRQPEPAAAWLYRMCEVLVAGQRGERPKGCA